MFMNQEGLIGNMDERPTCNWCGGHITNKQITDASKHHSRWGGLFSCKKCQSEIDKKYDSCPKHGKSLHNAMDKKYWKSIRLKDKMINGEL